MYARSFCMNTLKDATVLAYFFADKIMNFTENLERQSTILVFFPKVMNWMKTKILLLKNLLKKLTKKMQWHQIVILAEKH